MLLAVVARTFSSMARRWQRVLLVHLAVAAMGTLVLGFLWLVHLGYGADGSAAAVLVGLLAALAGQALANWAFLAGLRAASGRSRVVEALVETTAGALRLLVLFGMLAAAQAVLGLVHPAAALVLAIVMVVPAFIAIGDVAFERGSWGLRAWQRGILQLPRNLGAYVATLLVLAMSICLAAMLLLAPFAVLVGVPGVDDLASAAAVGSYLQQSVVAAVVGGLLATIVLVSTVPCLGWAVYSIVLRVDTSADWDDEGSVEAVTVDHELSPVIESLIGSGPAPAMPRRRMQVPPRASQPGRLPGPGAMDVVGVALPPGSTSRPVDSPTLELDSFDAAPSGAPGTMVVPAAATMWVSSRPVDNAPALWKQLAGGFSESGLWPVLLPAASEERAPWFEQRARRERDSLDATASELFAARLEGSLRDSPLRSTSMIVASAVARGELRRGSGRRTDALGRAFEHLGPSRIALVGVRRPAEVVHRTAWPGTVAAGITGAELAELVASWEERYGALLVAMSPTQLSFAVLRPPATFEEAVEVAAEHHATCPDEAEAWGDDRTYAESLVNQPTWQLGWS